MNFSKSITVLFILLLLNISILYSQNSTAQPNKKETSKTIYFQSSALFKCIMKFPPNYNPNNKYPLVVGLHGGNGSPAKFIDIWKGIEQPELIYAVPQAPYAWFMNAEFGYDWSLWPTGNEKFMEQAAVLTENYIADLLKDITKRYQVSEVYLLGFSQGAIFTFRAGIKNHHLIDGLICLSGPGLLEKLNPPFSDPLDADWLPEKYLKAGNQLRIFISNGEKDKFTPVELGIKSRDILNKYGYEVTFHTFDGGHTVDKNIIKLVLKWLNKNSKG